MLLNIYLIAKNIAVISLLVDALNQNSYHFIVGST